MNVIAWIFTGLTANSIFTGLTANRAAGPN